MEGGFGGSRDGRIPVKPAIVFLALALAGGGSAQGAGMGRVFDEVYLAAGSGSYGRADGPVPASRLNTPGGVAVNADGTVLYVADTGNNRLCKVDLAHGLDLTTLAGSGAGVQDGEGSAAQLSSPNRV